MDHAFIDKFAIADRYVKRTLPAAERVTFETHLVDCQECADRVLLAEMLRNGGISDNPRTTERRGVVSEPREGAASPCALDPIPVQRPPRTAESSMAKARTVSNAQLWRFALLFAAAAAALLAVPTAVFLWELHRLR